LRPDLERLIAYLYDTNERTNDDTHEPKAAGFITGILVSLVNRTEARVAVYAEAH
jgi:hypothetical protein